MKVIITEEQFNNIKNKSLVNEGIVELGEKGFVAALKFAIKAMLRVGVNPRSPVSKYVIKPIIGHYLKNIKNWAQLFKILGKKLTIRGVINIPKNYIKGQVATDVSPYIASREKDAHSYSEKTGRFKTSYMGQQAVGSKSEDGKEQVNEVIATATMLAIVCTILDIFMEIITKVGLPKILSNAKYTKSLYNKFSKLNDTAKLALSILLPGEAICQLVQAAVGFGIIDASNPDFKNYGTGIYDIMAMLTNKQWISNGNFSTEEIEEMVIAYNNVDSEFINTELNSNPYVKKAQQELNKMRP